MQVRSRIAKMLSLCVLGFIGYVQSSASIVGAHGGPVSPLLHDGRKASVLFFVLADCPIAREYSPEMNRIVRDYDGKGVKFTIVHVDRSITQVAATQHAKAFGMKCSVGIDRKHDFVRLAGITNVPSVALFDSTENLKYSGRIDDRYAKFGTLRPRVEHHDLRAAIEAVLAGRAVETPKTAAIGCFVPD